MNIQIRSLDEHNLGQVNQRDNGFQVENKLCLHVNHEEIHYSIVHTKKFEKRYHQKSWTTLATYMHGQNRPEWLPEAYYLWIKST